MANITRAREPEITLLIDEQGAITYLGRAKLGTATSETKWQVRRIQLSGTQNTFQYANGSRRYNQIWDNRAALSYSN